MKRRSHPILAIFLGLLLIVTGHSMAIARGATAATGQMILCTGDGAVLVYTDADGQPTAAPNYCPDCALSILDVLVQPDNLTGRFKSHEGQTAPAQTRNVFVHLHSAYKSRAPPKFV